MRSANIAGVIDCAPSHQALSGLLWTSIINRRHRLLQRLWPGRLPSALARSMAGIDDDWQVALAFDGQDGAQIEGVAGVRFKSTDAPFAEDDVVVAFSHDVFCRHEPFFDSRAQAPLEKDRLVRLADGFEEVRSSACSGPRFG